MRDYLTKDQYAALSLARRKISKIEKVTMEKPRKKELLDCPFCGSEADIECQGKSAWVVGCMNKSCEVFLPTYSWFTSRENAINAWNTRPAMSTWLEGQVPSVEIIERIIRLLQSDICGETLLDDDNAAAKLIHALLLRKLTGKVT